MNHRQSNRRTPLRGLLSSLWVTGLISPGLLLATAVTAPPGAPVFESDILPILRARCIECHGESAPQAGLDLRTPGSMLHGGRSGPVFSLGSAEDSLLVRKVVSQAMPPGPDKLSRKEMDLLRLWIEQGARSARQQATVTEQDVLPIFQMRCAVCHGKRKQEGGLDLRSLAGRLKGGRSGPALVPGDPESSLLFHRITAGEMPPPELLYKYRVRPPSNEEVETLRRWIAAGALAGDSGRAEQAPELLKEEDRQFWSFQPPQRPEVPSVRQAKLVRNPIDSFLLKKLESRKLGFSPPADGLVLLRRAYLDLIGMPPTAAEVEAYLKDRRADAYEHMIERLLASPHYGERWAQHWLDVAGYSDTEGIKFADLYRSHAWRYRDFVIRSLNRDKPYNRFLTEQLAGDELVDPGGEITPEVVESLSATGFLRLVSDPTNSPSNASLAEKMDVIHDEIKVLSSSVLGLTLGCARCHDHKYDPISQQDYYRFSAILQTAYDPYDWVDPTRRFLDIALREDKEAVARFNAPVRKQIEELDRSLEAKAAPLRREILERRLAELPQAIQEDLRALRGVPKEKYSPVQKYLARRFKNALEVSNAQIALESSTFKEALEKHEASLKELKAKLRPEPAVRALYDMGGEPSAAYLLRRGEANAVADRVYPGVPAVLRAGLPPFSPVPPRSETSGNRLALARWLTHPHHPLTARVIVNRIWMHHFGRGLVATPSNFGRTGARPSHPELLDWLATEMVSRGWSLKAMHRLMMTSTAYRQSSRATPENRKDPDNRLWSRMRLRRMDAEVLFDAMLRVTGRLNPERFGPASEVEKLPSGEVVPKEGRQGWRRSIYIQKRRLTPVTLFDLFDSPRMAPNCTERRYSTVAPQALQLLNGHMARRLARYFAGRLIDAFPGDPGRQVDQLYLTALARQPTARERDDALASLSELAREWESHLAAENSEAPRKLSAQWSALASMCHAVLSSAEFLYID